MPPSDGEELRAGVEYPAEPAERPGGWRAPVARAYRTGLRTVISYLGVGGVLILLCVYLGVTEEGFATWANFQIILEANAVLLVVAVGLTFVLIVGGLDLSMGGMVALSGMVLAKLALEGFPLGAVVVVILAGATLVGLLVNGVLISKLGLSFLVVTLGTAGVFQGVALLLNDGQTVTLVAPGFLGTLGSGRVGGIAWLIVVSVGVLVVSTLVLRYTGFGRMVYAVGGNQEAARLAGINVTVVRASVYALAAGLAGLAGILNTSRLSAADPTAGQLIVLEAAAAVLLGGTSFLGGRGTMLGTFLGVLFLGVLANGITRLEISPYWTPVIGGSTLIAALLLDRLRYRAR